MPACVYALISSALLLCSVRAHVTLPPHLSSGAVLQTWRGSHTATHIYGSAAPGETVTVTSSVKGVPPFSTTAAASGEWLIAYNWPPGPTEWDNFDVNVTGSSAPDSPILLKGVRWGDVILCMGDASSLLPVSLSAGGDAWLANSTHALGYMRLFPASVRGSCAWGGSSSGTGPPCDTWTNASVSVGAGFSAACLQTAVEATRAKGFGGNSVVGIIVLAANESAVEDWLPPVGIAAAAACAPLSGAPPSSGALWAAAGARFAEFPMRYYLLALGASDASRATAAITSTGDAPAVADAYACRVRALIAGLRAGPSVGDSVVLMLEPGPGAVQPGAQEGYWALRVGLARALPGALPGVGVGVTSTALVSAIDAGDGSAVNSGGACASTATIAAAVRGGAALAHVAWWAFQVSDVGPRATFANNDADGSAVIVFAFSPNVTANASTLALVSAPQCVACCSAASAGFQVAPASTGPWTDVTPTLSSDKFSLRLPPSNGSVHWVRVGAGDPASPQCFLVDAETQLPAFAFALEVSSAARRVVTPPRRRAGALSRESPPPLPHAAEPLAPGTMARRAYLLEAASRAARVAATPVRDRYAGLAAVPPRYFNTWQAFRCNLDEGLMLSAGRVLVDTGLAALGFVSVNSDDCEWRTARDNVTGAVVADETRWPNGFAALADALDALDVPLGLGVYTSQTSSTCVGRPASYGYEEVDAATWCKWGATTVKVDNCGGERYPASNTSWIKLRAALDTCAHDVLLAVESCGVPSGGSGANPSCASWIRTTGVQMFRTTADLQLYWQSAMYNLDGNEWMAPLAGPGVWPDPDMLIVGHGILSQAEEQSHWSAWVIAAAPLGLAFDLSRGIPNNTLALISSPEVLAIHADPAGVAGVRATPSNSTGTECWAKPLADGGGNATAILLFNRGNVSADVLCSWVDVAPHWPAHTQARVRDVYARTDLGVFTGGFTARGLETHASLLVVATPE